MRDATFFTHPKADWQRRYEALRASFVDRLSAGAIAARPVRRRPHPALRLIAVAPAAVPSVISA
jgi:hypothetical protein